ncbi:MAG: M1 family metallopeptidase [Bacteroidia bacterium]|nr:M1 family metallopeptidase [Bacteroidia bacterium]
MQKNRSDINNLRKLSKTHTIRQLLFIGLIIIWPFCKASSQEYFQQEVNYRMHVTLNDKRNELNAFETVEYINNSPDSLRFLYFHLWPNGYLNNKTELAKQLLGSKGKAKLFNDPELKGFIDSLDFNIDGQRVKWNLLPNQSDICQIWLNKILKPGDTIKIATPFHVKIPKGVTSRLGHIGESYQISQWYPKPAVYDKSGWHQMSYQDQGEFYSEYGSYDVSITLPQNYIVGATGNLHNEQETEMLNKLAADTSWIATLNVEESGFPPSSNQLKTLRYTEKQIHDFAWFADKRFHVLKGKVKLPDSGREVTTWVMFTNQQAKLWAAAIPYVNNAIWYFSKWNGDYPYQSFTAVQSALSAGDGMEYPGITVIGMAKDAYSLDEVIAHEVCHSWFYSALGSDERRYPFMDEGITSSYEVRYMKERYPQKKLWETYINNKKLAKFFHIDKMPVQQMSELEWLSQARDNLEQPVNLPASDYTTLNYSLMIYNKAGTGFNYLRAYLGDSLYDLTMHDYYRKWKFRHPQPDDLRKIFESNTGKDLTWFFSDFIGTTKRMDYEVVRLADQQLLVKNNGELISPFVISGMIGDSICFEQWIDGFKGEKWIDLPPGNYTELKIDPGHVTPELFRLNNNIRTSGSFRKTDPIRTQLYFSLEDPEKLYLMYIPVLNWTRENGFMVGIALHNGFLTPKPLEYFVVPFYSFHHSGLAGFGKISYHMTPYDKIIRMATFSVEGTQFGAPGNQNYRNLKAGINIDFRANPMNSAATQTVYGYYSTASDLFQIEHFAKAQMRSYFQVGYQLEKTSIINPYQLLVSAESGQSFLKTSVELNYRLSYYGKKKGLDIRMFAGTMLKENANIPFYSLSASGRSGREQYLYQGTYPDRFGVFPTSFWSRQTTFSEGGLVSPINDNLGYSRWLVSLSFASSLPGKTSWIPIKPFANFLLNDHSLATGNRSPFFYEAGIKAGLWNFFEVYIPLIVSQNIESCTGSVKDRIRIVFNLNSFNQAKLNSGIGIQIR